jgi:hypothetical protein
MKKKDYLCRIIFFFFFQDTCIYTYTVPTRRKYKKRIFKDNLLRDVGHVLLRELIPYLDYRHCLVILSVVTSESILLAKELGWKHKAVASFQS